jgi:hypothetical protein
VRSFVPHESGIDPIAALPSYLTNVCCLRQVGHDAAIAEATLLTRSGHRGGYQIALQKRLDATYSITSSAVASSVGGTSTPSVLAVLRLMTSSNLVG